MPDFGYSVGDFIGVGTLVSRTIKFLVESRDASEDCQLLINSLRSLEASITTARNTMDASYGTPATVNAIRHELDACEKLINDFYESSKEYTESLCNGSNKSFVIREIRKISWTMFKTGDIQRLERDLAAHSKALSLLVGLLPCEMIQRIQNENLKSGEAQAEYSAEMDSDSIKCFGSTRSSAESSSRMAFWRESTHPRPPGSVYSGPSETTYPGTWNSVDSGYASPDAPSPDGARYFGHDGVFHEAPAGFVLHGNGPRQYGHEGAFFEGYPPTPGGPRPSRPPSTLASESDWESDGTLDREVLQMKKELEQLRKEKRMKEEKQREADLKKKIREEAEASFTSKMEAMKQAQAEAQVEIERAKKQAMEVAREALEAERKAEEEKRRLRDEEMARVERAAREKFEAEMRARAEAKRREEAARQRVEEVARGRLEAERKAEEEARAAAKRKWFRFPRKNSEIGTGTRRVGSRAGM